MILVLCPQCKHQMRYQPRGGRLTQKRKRCVYCGHTFAVHRNQRDSRLLPQSL